MPRTSPSLAGGSARGLRKGAVPSDRKTSPLGIRYVERRRKGLSTELNGLANAYCALGGALGRRADIGDEAVSDETRMCRVPGGEQTGTLSVREKPLELGLDGSPTHTKHVGETRGVSALGGAAGNRSGLVNLASSIGPHHLGTAAG